MPKSEWGTKRVCPVTGKRFYDLNKTPVISPYTGEVVNLETARHSRVLVADKADAASKTKAEDEEVLLDDDEDIEEDAADTDLDDDLLEDDDDDDTVSLDDIADVPGGDDES
jgi:uncharacterized protein (TIGR02300 family)